MFGMFSVFSHINLMGVIDTINTWGKEYWGFVLVLFAANYFLSNFIRNVRAALRRPALRQIERFGKLANTGTPYMVHTRRRTTLNFDNRRPNLSDQIKKSSDMEVANALGQWRLNRMSGHRGYMPSGE